MKVTTFAALQEIPVDAHPAPLEPTLIIPLHCHVTPAHQGGLLSKQELGDRRIVAKVRKSSSTF